MKLSEIKDVDVPIIVDLLQNLLKKHETIHFLRFKGEENFVTGVEVKHEDHNGDEKDSVVVDITSNRSNINTSQSLAWEIPKLSDRLVLKKMDGEWVLYDPEWIEDDDPEALKTQDKW